MLWGRGGWKELMKTNELFTHIPRYFTPQECWIVNTIAYIYTHTDTITALFTTSPRWLKQRALAWFLSGMSYKMSRVSLAEALW